MKKPKAVLRCSVCGAKHEHYRDRVKLGWFAIYKTDKMRQIRRLICPDCLQGLGIKASQSLEPITPLCQNHDAIDNEPRQICRLL